MNNLFISYKAYLNNALTCTLATEGTTDCNRLDLAGGGMLEPAFEHLQLMMAYHLHK